MDIAYSDDDHLNKLQTHTLEEVLQDDSLYTKRYSCSERILYASNVAFSLDLPVEALRLSSGFGGGMGSGLSCGLLTGGVLVLGVLFARDTSRESPKLKAAVQRFVSKFETVAGATDCARLKPIHRHPETGCDALTISTGRVLMEIIKEFGGKN